MAKFVAKRMDIVPPSGIRRFFDIAATMQDVISLGVGEPDFVTPDNIRRAAVDSIEKGQTRYTSNAGILELRQLVQAHLNHRYGVDYDPIHEMIITVGVSEALQTVCLASLNPGEEVLIPEPSFVSYAPSVIFAGATPVYVPTSVDEQFMPTVADLEARVTPNTRALLLGYPNNPTGAVLTPQRALEIAEFAKKHDLLVFSDEIYDRLVYGVEHICIAALPGMKERTVTLGGFSKAYAMTGWRIGYVCAPADIIGASLRIHQYAIMSAPTAGQHAAIEALKNNEHSVLEMVAEYDRRRQFMVKSFNEIGLPCFEPKGAFYTFPSIKATGMNEDDFCEKLLVEEHVAVVPGYSFGPSGAGHIRACYATSLPKIEEAMERINRFVRRYSSVGVR
ncbi:aminotransferase class I/II-fold pyridoxal phosphate-dependent enzyme [Candidatus Chlorohelix allophototropha]|uniref:Aminotransferase n=2 Tax=Candidatus Chlorohelix allophototropha TaxID=3003348 RepID=A0ABY9B4X3_9CHLR|nr:aminotransferase class I/II-fold pyridoxal phosphate-dependent enzyme [Chloroflexota bacterium L227-S17]